MELSKNKDYVLNAVSEDGLALKNFSDEFRKDKEFILKAVSQNGYALENAEESLKKIKNLYWKLFHKMVMH